MKVERYSLAGFLKLLEDHSYSANGDYELFSNPKEETFALAKVYYETRLKEDKPEMIDIDFRLVKSIITMKSKKVHNAHFTSDGKIIAEDADGAFDLGQYARILNRNLHDEESLNLIRDLVNVGYKDGSETTNYPKDYIMPISAVADVLARGEMKYRPGDEDLYRLTVSNKNGTDVLVNLALDDKSVTIPEDINAFDIEVLRAIISLYRAGNRLFWPEQIYYVLSGHAAGETMPKVTEVMVSDIAASVKKLMVSRLRIDCTDQLNSNPKYKNHGLRSTIISENMLLLREYTGTLKNGKKIHGWEYAGNQAPILYQYSNAIKQLTTVPCKLLNTGGRNSAAKIAIRGYMLQEIRKMQSNTRNNKKILYKRVLDCCGAGTAYLDSTGKQTKAGENLLKRCKGETGYFAEFCGAWAEQGLIKGFTILSDGVLIDL